MYYIAGDVVNYIVFYDCVSCNDYGDQGSECQISAYFLTVDWTKL
jgi:hypothetical protein